MEQAKRPRQETMTPPERMQALLLRKSPNRVPFFMFSVDYPDYTNILALERDYGCA